MRLPSGVHRDIVSLLCPWVSEESRRFLQSRWHLLCLPQEERQKNKLNGKSLKPLNSKSPHVETQEKRTSLLQRTKSSSEQRKTSEIIHATK
ncbi:hypothetical protein Avbf_17071 [Armadillidium vulgare]|nr:hypothetical protein Avbf_17071 [Armadillidium vulgare]